MASYLDHFNLLIAGKMNAGKSTLCNLLTQQDSSIVDATPGTTADTKVVTMEIHGLGPVKLFDSAGIDEPGALGNKKRQKVLANLKSCDLLFLLLDPDSTDFSWEKQLLDKARYYGKRFVIGLNQRGAGAKGLPEVLKEYGEAPLLVFNAQDKAFRPAVLDFIKDNSKKPPMELPLLPFVEAGQYYVLVIPMDDETPEGRLLRPQTLALEFITRRFAFPVCYRLDLAKARSAEAAEKEGEYRRFQDFLRRVKPAAVIIDSQSVDVMSGWVPEEVLLTTFSVMMIQQQSRGQLKAFVRGQAALTTLKAGDRVLIYEACNHSRIGEDIGTVQIPRLLEKMVPGVAVEHAFGRQLAEVEDLQGIKLIIHCGGCMLSPQVLGARLRDLDELAIPYSNYGLFLSARLGPGVLERVVTPFLSYN